MQFVSLFPGGRWVGVGVSVMDGWDIYRWSRQDIHYKSKQDDANKAEPEPKSKEKAKQTIFEPGVDAVGKQNQGRKMRFIVLKARGFRGYY